MSEARATTEQSESAAPAAEQNRVAAPGPGALGSLGRGGAFAAGMGRGRGGALGPAALQLQRTCGNAALNRLIGAPARPPAGRGMVARSPLDTLDSSGLWYEAERERKAELEKAETGQGRQRTLERIGTMTDQEARKDAAGIAFRAQDRGDVGLAAAAAQRLLDAWLNTTDVPGTLSSWGADDAVDTVLDRAERALSAKQLDLGGKLLSIGMVQIVRAANVAVARRPATGSDDDVLRGFNDIFMSMQRTTEQEIRTRLQRGKGLLDRFGREVSARADAVEKGRFEAMAKVVQAAERRAGPAIPEDFGDIGAEPAPGAAGSASRNGRAPRAAMPATPPPRPKETPQAPVSRASESIVNAAHQDLEGALVFYATQPMRYSNIKSPRYGVTGTLAGARRMAQELFGRRGCVIVEDVTATDPQTKARQIRYLVLALNLRLAPPNAEAAPEGTLVGVPGITMLSRPASSRYFFLATTSGPWIFFQPALLDYVKRVEESEGKAKAAGNLPTGLNVLERREAIFGPIDKLIDAGETQDAADALTFVGVDGFRLVDTAAKTRYIATLLRAFTFAVHQKTVVEIFRAITTTSELKDVLAGLKRENVLDQLRSDMDDAFGSLLIAVGQAVGSKALTAAQARRLLSELRVLQPFPGIEVRGDGSIGLGDAEAEISAALEQLYKTIKSAITGILDIIMDPEAFVKGIYKLCYFAVMADLADKGHPEAIKYVTKVVDGIARQVGAAVRGLAVLQENMPAGVEFVRDLQRAIEWRIVWEIVGLFVGVGEAVAFVDAVRGGRAAAAVAEMADALKAARAAEETAEAGKLARGGRAAEREAGELGGDTGRTGRAAVDEGGEAGRAGRAAGEVTREVPNGAKIRYHADGRRTLCINPCAELDHLGLADNTIDAALRNLHPDQTTEFIETLAHFKAADEVPIIRDMVSSLAKGSEEAASAAELLERINNLRKVEGFEFKLADLAAAHQRGDAVLHHGPIQTPEFLEDMKWGDAKIESWELHSGQLSFPGRPPLSEHKLPPRLEKLDFVIIEAENGTKRLVLGRNHSGLSGGRGWVYAAGELQFSATGELIAITRASGHYQPAVRNLERAREVLREHNMLSPRGVALVEAVP